MLSIEELSKNPKVFITGLYGTGKSTLAKKITMHSKTHNWLSYDHIVGYGDRGNRFALLYELLESSNSFVLDALPVGIHYEHWNLLLNFIETSKSKILITKCDFDVWHSERLESKLSVSDDIVELESHYKSFYLDENGLYRRCLDTFTQDTVFLYDTTFTESI